MRMGVRALAANARLLRIVINGRGRPRVDAFLLAVKLADVEHVAWLRMVPVDSHECDVHTEDRRAHAARDDTNLRPPVVPEISTSNRA